MAHKLKNRDAVRVKTLEDHKRIIKLLRATKIKIFVTTSISKDFHDYPNIFYNLHQIGGCTNDYRGNFISEEAFLKRAGVLYNKVIEIW